MALVNTVEYIWNNKEEGATSIAVELNLLLEKSKAKNSSELLKLFQGSRRITFSDTRTK